MPEMTEYKPGMPSWVDLGTPDLDKAIAFYTAFFGWEAHRAPQPEAGGYTMFSLNGKYVAGAGPLMSEQQPPAWSIYFHVIEADATLARVIAHGGSAPVEPFDVLDVGRMGVFADPDGAVFSVWEPRAHKGAGLIWEPNTFGWTELWSRDPHGAKHFYPEVFEWGVKENGEGPQAYTEWQVDGRSIAGMLEIGPHIPADVPPHWVVYFVADDCDAMVAKANGLGATTAMEPMDIPFGRFAILRDPTGATFAIIKMGQAG
jgi:predicted enzyme related to lactoylglutathione lyase